MTQYRLGRIEHHDPRSRIFVARQATTLRSVTHTPPPASRRLDQGNLGSCEGNAAAQLLNTRPLHKPRTPYHTEPDAVQAYSLATGLDGFAGTYPPDDTGTSNVAIAKAARQLGWITGFRWHFGLDATLAGLVLEPLLVGMPWRQDMFTPDRHGFIHATGTVVGGHAFVLFGLNVRDRYVWMLNSWSDWGLQQRAKITFDDLGKLLSDGGEVTAFDVAN